MACFNYFNTDVTLCDALGDSHVERICVTYDIFCKYGINFRKRLEALPDNLTESIGAMTIRGYVPKFHLPAHGASCQSPWSLNYASGVGRTDGEGVERDWAETNWLATQTFEMGPGHRHGVLNDHFGFLNFTRLCGLGTWLRAALCTRSHRSVAKLLGKRFEGAVYWEPVHREAADKLVAQHASHVAGWRKMISEWEVNKKKKDPYAEPESSAFPSSS
jgi:hypothetical protein